MKFLPAIYSYMARSRSGRRNVLFLLRFFLAFAVLVVIYSTLFHYLMAAEGREYSWITGFYWTLTVMSTLGFGDITFTSDPGRLFSMAVLLSGIVYLLVLLPFTIIEFFYAPWMRAQKEARAPRKLPDDIEGHVLIAHLDPVTEALIPRLVQYGYDYAVIVPDIEEALRLHDEGLRIVVGELDDPVTFKRCHVDRAALVVATASDMVNTNIAFTVRELSENVPVMTTANNEESLDILELAGSTHVLQLGEMMGQALARRTIGGDAMAHEIGRFDNLIIAEATASGTPLVGKTLAESRLRELVGTTVVGVWERGRFTAARPDAEISQQTVFILAGLEEQIRNYNQMFCIYHQEGAPVVVIGGGRVGRATGAALKARGIDYRIVESDESRIHDRNYVLGDAASIKVLTEAGIEKAPAVFITPHEDDVNIYLTIYCRRLRPDIQIISRAALERNVSTLHRAGADFVLSYASMGANAILNLMKDNEVLMLAEGLDVFRVPVPEPVVGKSLLDSGIREKSGCSVVGLYLQSGEVILNPLPATILPARSDIVLIGGSENQKSFLKRFAG